MTPVTELLPCKAIRKKKRKMSQGAVQINIDQLCSVGPVIVLMT